MLLQSHEGFVEVFPAIPEHWKDIRFRNLRTEGAFLISAERKAGQWSSLEATATQGGTFRIRIPSGMKSTTQPIRIEPGDIAVFELKVGEKLLFEK